MTDKKSAEGKKSFAESLLKKDTQVTDSGDNDPQKGFTKEWQPGTQAFNLRLWWKDGRKCDGIPWLLYSGDGWRDGVSGAPECFTVAFGERVVTVEGYNLKRLVEQLDEGHLKSIREHDSKEVALIRNEKPGDPMQVQAAIVRIAVDPPFEDFAKAIQKGENETRNARHTKGRQPARHPGPRRGIAQTA